MTSKKMCHLRILSCSFVWSQPIPSSKAWVACHYERRLKRPDSWP